MVNAQLHGVLRHLHGLRDARALAEAPDAQLLEWFARGHEEAPFAALVRRHGPMVWGVSRRVLPHVQDAEDVFQATFLLLARKAGSIRKPESVGGWLHGVAHRLALKARLQQARRQSREKRAADMRPTRAGGETSLAEVQEALDAALGELPEMYRAALVLCYLEGTAQEEAARRLGCPLATLRTRLARGRKLLRNRLVRHGLTLSAAGLATLLIASAAPAAAPAALVKAATRAALPFAAGQPAAALCSKQAAGLVAGGLRAMFLTKVKMATALVLAVGLVAGAAALVQRGTAANGAAKPPAAAGATPPPAAAKPPAADEADAVTCAGRVLGPDGRPFAGARLVLWTSAVKKHDDLPTKATTGADGRFHFAVAREDLRRDAKVVATAKGYGPDFEKLTPDAKPREVTLRLVRDDVPIEGRILNLEGQPLAGITVSVGWLELGDRKAWLDARARGVFEFLKTLSPVVLDVPTSAKTDGSGRVRLTGFGRGRIMHLTVRGPGVGTSDVDVITEPGAADRLPPNLRVNGPTFQHAVRPAKPVVGTVRDRRTGEPLAGAQVVCPGDTMEWQGTRTDAEGHYRIDGVGKRERYAVAATAMPYFNATKWEVSDTPGLEPLRVDFELDRGVAIHGRLLDKGTGRPVRGTVEYGPLAGNPHVQDYPDLIKPQILVQDFGKAAADGSFTVIAIPGPGVLTAQAADADAYLEASPGGLRPARGPSLEGNQAVVRIDPDPKDGKSLACDVFLQPGRSVKVTVVGPDGKPVTGARAGGMHTVYRYGEDPMKVEGDTFRFAGLGSDQARPLVVVHPGKGLAKLLVVPPDQKDPLVVRLERTGAIAGRVLDADGRPQAGLKVEVTYQYVQTIEGAGTRVHLPRAMRFVQSGWQELLNGQATTDGDGRFRIPGLAPGLKYDLHTAAGLERHGLTVEPGKDHDLGDVK